MIRKYSHKTINREQYTRFLQQTLNYRIYAELWYLDIVSPEGYDIFILNDFEAVMPVAYQKKLGLKFVVQPTFCQQLGIFYPKPVSENNFEKLFSILKQYRVRSYNFNEENTLYFSLEQERKNNQLLPLNRDYLPIYNSFNSNRKRELQKALKMCWQVEEEFSIDSVMNLVKEYPVLRKHQKNLLKLLTESQNRNIVKPYLIKSSSGISGCIILITSQNRLISLLPLKSKEKNIKGIITYLYNHIIQKNSLSNSILDFEGSMIPGIADFNKSLGAESRYYVTYRNFKWFEVLKNLKTSNHFH